MLKQKLSFLLVFGVAFAHAQKVTFTEYDLKNGLHVVLHKDQTAPVVAVSVMYHVGSKDEQTNRTGFAHFFEHLLFEGSDNIKRGEFMKIVSSNGGQNNANTSQDRTFYYEIFPSNQLETGLWLESERMMHPVINEIGVKTQNEVVKEEKRLRVDNQPYGNFIAEIMKRLFTKHPYNWVPIGSMEHLDAATLQEFIAFNKKYYTPNNAVLVIAGDIDVEKTKKLVESYFGEIPAGEPIVRNPAREEPITKEIIDTAYDNNIQIPAIMTAYRTPGMTSKESTALQLASDVLSQGASSRMYKKMVDEKKNSLQVGSFNYTLEDYGAYITYALPSGAVKLDTLLRDMDEEIVKLQHEVRKVRVDDSVADYLLEIVRATREHEDLRVGVSTRGALTMYRAAQALAFLGGRDFVVPDDLKSLVGPVLAHRIVGKSFLQAGEFAAAEAILRDIVDRLEVPV